MHAGAGTGLVLACKLSCLGNPKYRGKAKLPLICGIPTVFPGDLDDPSNSGDPIR